MRNPWGDGAEWGGAWSDSSRKWREHPDVAAALDFKPAADGIFWMEFADFAAIFDRLQVSHRRMRTGPGYANRARWAAPAAAESRVGRQPSVPRFPGVGRMLSAKRDQSEPSAEEQMLLAMALSLSDEERREAGERERREAAEAKARKEAEAKGRREAQEQVELAMALSLSDEQARQAAAAEAAARRAAAARAEQEEQVQIAMALSLSDDQARRDAEAARVPPPAATTDTPGGAAPECLLHGVECPQRPPGGWGGHERELRLHLNIACDGGQQQI
jgi:hypothetical protein